VYIQNNYTSITNNITIINNASSYNNTTYFAGPRRQEVERVSGRSIATVSIAAVNHPVASRVSANQLSIYRPQIQKSVVVNNGVRQQAVTSRPAQFTNVQRSNVTSPYNNNTFRSNNAQTQRLQQYSPNQNAIRQNSQQAVQQVRPYNYNNNAQFQRQQQSFNTQNPVRQQMPVQRTFNQDAQRQQQQNMQAQRQNMMQNMQQQRQSSMQAQRQQSMPVQRQAPVQRQPERSFASVQRPVQQHNSQPSFQSPRPSGNMQAFRGRR
jgi:hypothetical protein